MLDVVDSCTYVLRWSREPCIVLVPSFVYFALVYTSMPSAYFKDISGLTMCLITSKI